MKNIILLLCALVLLSGCMSTITNYIVDKGIRNLGNIESFQGTSIETGLLDDGTAIRTSIAYVKPDRFIAQVLAPKEFKGDTFVSDGTTLSLYYAKPNIGIIFKGLNTLIPDTVQKYNQRQRNKTLEGAELFTSKWKGRTPVAGRKAHRFTMVPKEEQKYLFNENFYSDPEFSLPLKVEMLTRDAAPVYSFVYEDITFNNEIPDREFVFAFPPDANVATWDLTGRNYTLAHIKKQMNFKVLLPKDLPESMKLIKTVKAPGFVPAACMVYSDDLYHIILTQVKDYGITAMKPRGIKVPEIADNARLLFSGESVLISWTRQDVILVLSGNLPYYEMLAIAEHIN